MERASSFSQVKGLMVHQNPKMPALALAVFAAMFAFATSEIARYTTERCRVLCGNQTIKYPFGLQEGCGRPEFQLRCNDNMNGTTELRLNSKIFSVNGLDYSNKKIIVRDSQMSDCNGLKQEDPGFSLDWSGTSYTMTESTVLLLNCLAFQIEIEVNPLNSEYDCKSPACVAFITSCLDGPIPCCELTSPGNLDLQPLQCQSYTSAYSPGKPMFDATKWSYGLVLEWDYPMNDFYRCRDCESSNGVCGYNVSGVQHNFICICNYGNTSNRCQDCFDGTCSQAQQTAKEKHSEKHRTAKTSLVVGLVIGTAMLIFPLAILCFIFLSRKKKQARIEAAEIGSNDNDSFTNEESNNHLLPMVLQHMGSLSYSPMTLFSYDELRSATDSFSEDRLLGDGGYGTVYEAKFSDGRVAAVKILNYQNNRRFEQFYNEVRILAKARHPNLVELQGFCLEGRDLILVYELLPNGTLEEHLLGTRGHAPMPWATRVAIAIEVAEALAYLHGTVSPPIFHRDVKSSNILLDNAFHAKLADFGLSRLVPMEASHVSTAPQGTLGYLDPEYHQTFRLTDKSDVYSFGVVLMELISSRRAVDLGRGVDEANLCALAVSKMQSQRLHEIVDPFLGIEKHPGVRQMVDRVAEVAFKCLALSRNQRPTMAEVLAELRPISEVATLG